MTEVEEYIVLNLTDSLIKTAEQKAERLGKLNNSIRNGDGNLVGYIGQDSVLAVYPAATSEDTYDYDVYIGEFAFDVKTTDRTVVPQVHYNCPVSDYNTKQKTDFYIFVSTLREKTDYKKAYIVGFLSKEQFFKIGKFRPKGDIDDQHSATCDCHVVQIKDLRPPRELFRLN